MVVEQYGFNALLAATRAPRIVQRTPAAEKLRAKAIALAQAEDLGTADFAYRIVAIDAIDDGLLTLGAERLFAPWLVPERGELTALGIGLATLGPRLEQRVKSLFAERQAALALALDQLGSELLLAASARLEVRLRAEGRKRGLVVSGELRPGDPGLALAAQQSVLRLIEGVDLGVELHNGALLNPLKSVSVVYGIGVDLPAAQWSRCDLCPSRAKCTRVTHLAAS